MILKRLPAVWHQPACPYWILAGLLVAGGLWTLQGSARALGQAAEAPTSQTPSDPKQALQNFNTLIGKWRGVGMPRRGSRAGAWLETAEWIWDFQDKTPALKYTVKKGRLLRSARLTWDAKRKQFHLHATLPDETTRKYTGQRNPAGKLVLESPAEEEGASYRITLTQLNQKRTLLLHEKRTGQGLYRRVAEIGYTRAGTNLAVEGAGEIECIVTGGQGTIPVTYKGKTYYVCCSGCKQAFEDDPAGIIAAYEKKRADRQIQKKAPPHRD